MWSTIIGSLFIVSGLVFVAKPEMLRRRMKKKGLRKLRRYLLAIVASAGILLISAGWQLDGAPAKIFTVVGVLFLVKGAFLLKAKSADIITTRLMKVPTLYLRLFAVGQIILGIVIIMLRNE